MNEEKVRQAVKVANELTNGGQSMEYMPIWRDIFSALIMQEITSDDFERLSPSASPLAGGFTEAGEVG